MKSHSPLGALAAVLTVLFLPAAHGAVRQLLDLEPDTNTLVLTSLNGARCLAFSHSELCVSPIAYPMLVPLWYRGQLLGRR